jgi:hypothetical protein
MLETHPPYPGDPGEFRQQIIAVVRAVELQTRYRESFGSLHEPVTCTGEAG